MSADLRRDWSGLRVALIPKLIVRVRFASPAPTFPQISDTVRSGFVNAGLSQQQESDR
jgi:hypothetical protein